MKLALNRMGVRSSELFIFNNFVIKMAVNQPRVPKGSSAGGQFGFTNAGSAGAVGGAAATAGGGENQNASDFLNNAANAQDTSEHGGIAIAGENLVSASRSVQRQVDKWSGEAARVIADAALRNVDWNEQSRASASEKPTDITSFLVTNKGSDGKVNAVADIHVSKSAPNVKIENLSVNPSAQGSGVGTQTMGRIASFAERSGKGLELDAVTTSVTFFEKLGFIKVGDANNAYEIQNMILSPANTSQLAASTRATKKYEFEPKDGIYCRGKIPRRQQKMTVNQL